MMAEADLECVEKPCIDTLFRDFTVYRGERGALVLADARDALKKIPTASVVEKFD